MRELQRRDPVLAKAMSGLPPFPDFPVGTLRGSHFHALARSIIYQQLATAAATTIYGRVRSLAPGSRFPGTEQVLALSDEELRGAGLSANKARAMKDLALKTVSGELRLRSIGRLADDEVTRRLTAVWGIGEWTAQMFLIFKLATRRDAGRRPRGSGGPSDPGRARRASDPGVPHGPRRSVASTSERRRVVSLAPHGQAMMPRPAILILVGCGCRPARGISAGAHPELPGIGGALAGTGPRVDLVWRPCGGGRGEPRLHRPRR